MEISGIASKAAKRQGDCTTIGDTFYCDVVGGTIEQALKRVKDNMALANLTTARVVATNVFLDDLARFDAMNKIYAGFLAAGSQRESRCSPRREPRNQPCIGNGHAS